MSSNKPIYKITPSLINSYKYYKENPSKKSFDSFKQSLSNNFKGNKWTKRGTIYESEVFAGKHGKVSELVKDDVKQKLFSGMMDFGEFIVRLSGKSDAMNKAKKRIIDIKRVDVFSKTKYDYSFQHILYFFLNPDIEEFYYVLTYGEGDTIEGTKVIPKKRPNEEELKKMVVTEIEDFFKFLKENDLWDTYTEKQKYNKR